MKIFLRILNYSKSKTWCFTTNHKKSTRSMIRTDLCYIIVRACFLNFRCLIIYDRYADNCLIGAEGGDSCGISGTGETPQWSDSDRGGTQPAPRKASAWSVNQQKNNRNIVFVTYIILYLSIL